MRWSLLLLGLSVFCCFAEEKTRRVVNNRTFDLKPLFEWQKLLSKVGPTFPHLPPRPLPQWQMVGGTIFERGAHGTYVLVSDKPHGFIVIRNLPPLERPKDYGPFVYWDPRRPIGQSLNVYAMRLAVTNYVTTNRVPAHVFDHGRIID